MHAASRLIRAAASKRVVRCLWCHQASFRADVIRNRGLCARCVAAYVAISWRVIYDRDRKFGSIPANLRVAYRL
jgi:hypothetical protein